MGDSHRANVATSRQQEALYLVGKYSFWSVAIHLKAWRKPSKTAMHKIVADMAITQGSSFVVTKQPWWRKYVHSSLHYEQSID